MRFAVADRADGNRITGYGEGSVSVNGVEFGASILLFPDRPVVAWEPRSPEEIRDHHFAPLVEARPELVLLGTGASQRFPSPAVYRALIEQGIGIEVMTTAAACRTYNVLIADRRRVAAALILQPPPIRSGETHAPEHRHR